MAGKKSPKKVKPPMRDKGPKFKSLADYEKSPEDKKADRQEMREANRKGRK